MSKDPELAALHAEIRALTAQVREARRDAFMEARGELGRLPLVMLDAGVYVDAKAVRDAIERLAASSSSTGVPQSFVPIGDYPLCSEHRHAEGWSASYFAPMRPCVVCSASTSGMQKDDRAAAGTGMPAPAPLQREAGTTKPKHSPGPWRTCQASHGKCSCGLIWDATGEWAPAIVQQNSEELGVCVDHEQAWADGRLVAAAPEMFALLCEFRARAFEDTGLDWDCRARALLARIEDARPPAGDPPPREGGR